MSLKKYVVRLTETEREFCKKVIGKLLGSGQKVRRALFYSKPTPTGQHGPTLKSLMRFLAELKPLKISGSDSLSLVLSRHSTV